VGMEVGGGMGFITPSLLFQRLLVVTTETLVVLLALTATAGGS
jgi:hypothetical protein